MFQDKKKPDKVSQYNTILSVYSGEFEHSSSLDLVKLSFWHLISAAGREARKRRKSFGKAHFP